MPFELAQVVAQLVEAIGLLGEIEAGEDGAMDLAGCPAADLRAAMQENLEQAHDARLVDLEAGVADRADGDRAREALEEREVDVDVEPFGLITGEAVGNRLEGGAHGIEMIEPLAQTKVIEVVGDQLVAQEGRDLLVLLQEGALEVGARRDGRARSGR